MDAERACDGFAAAAKRKPRFDAGRGRY